MSLRSSSPTEYRRIWLKCDSTVASTAAPTGQQQLLPGRCRLQSPPDWRGSTPRQHALQRSARVPTLNISTQGAALGTLLVSPRWPWVIRSLRAANRCRNHNSRKNAPDQEVSEVDCNSIGNCRPAHRRPPISSHRTSPATEPTIGSSEGSTGNSDRAGSAQHAGQGSQSGRIRQLSGERRRRLQWLP
jgi:hypothetical protein